MTTQEINKKDSTYILKNAEHTFESEGAGYQPSYEKVYYTEPIMGAGYGQTPCPVNDSY